MVPYTTNSLFGSYSAYLAENENKNKTCYNKE